MDNNGYPTKYDHDETNSLSWQHNVYKNIFQQFESHVDLLVVFSRGKSLYVHFNTCS